MAGGDAESIAIIAAILEVRNAVIAHEKDLIHLPQFEDPVEEAEALVARCRTREGARLQAVLASMGRR